MDISRQDFCKFSPFPFKTEIWTIPSLNLNVLSYVHKFQMQNTFPLHQHKSQNYRQKSQKYRGIIYN